MVRNSWKRIHYQRGRLSREIYVNANHEKSEQLFILYILTATQPISNNVEVGEGEHNRLLVVLEA